MGRLKDSTRTVGSVAEQPCHEEVCKKTPPSIPTGTCEYYKQRHDNFIQRHQYDSKSNPDNPPDYYMNYGFKYCSRFKRETYDKLSSGGKKWLNRTLKLLQNFMEQGVVKKNWIAKINTKFNEKLGGDPSKFYTGIECRNGDFRAFAFATHPDAYDPTAMQTLPCSDLILIANTPDLKEWLSWDTWQQAGYVAENMEISDVALGCAKEAAGSVADALDAMAEKAEEVFRDLASHFSRWDGE